MKKSIIFLWMVTIIVIIFVALTQRYSIVAVKEMPVAFKLDKLTGKVWFVGGVSKQTLVPVKAPKDVK